MSRNLILNSLLKRTFSVSCLNNQKLNNVTVIGSGLMGSGNIKYIKFYRFIFNILTNEQE